MANAADLKKAQELSDQFDVLYNNITSNQAPGLNEYEKSVFLTKAQEEIIKNYFNAKSNLKQDGFDDSPKRQADFATLIKSTSPSSAGVGTFDIRAKAYRLPDDIFLCLNEQFTDGNIPLTVVPISYEEYDRLMAKPYKYPPKYQVWRLITRNESSGTTISYLQPGTDSELVTGEADETFTFRMETNSAYPVTVEITFADRIPTDDSPITITPVDGTSVSIDIVVGADYLQTFSAFYDDHIANNTQLFQYITSLTWPSATDDSWIADAIDSIITLTAHATTVTETVDRVITTAEFIARFKSSSPSYRIRYVKRPNPIILTNFGTAVNSLSIQGKSDVQPFDLPDELYEEILQRAVELAKVAWTNNGQDNVQLAIEAGKRSE